MVTHDDFLTGLLVDCELCFNPFEVLPTKPLKNFSRDSRFSWAKTEPGDVELSKQILFALDFAQKLAQRLRVTFRLILHGEVRTVF